MKYLVLRFDGLFQSYSFIGTEKVKLTSQFPTKSAVVGLLGCAMGIDRKARKDLSELSKSFRMAVRCDRTVHKVMDFQLVSGKTNPVGVHVAVDSLLNGGRKESVSNKLIDKEYLSDTGYTVLLEGTPEFLEKCEKAVRDPKWMYVLGRYNCIPSIPIYAKKGESCYVEGESFEDAFSKLPLLDRHSKTQNNVYWVEEEIVNTDNIDPNSYKIQYDNVIENTQVGSFSYGERLVRQYVVKVQEG